MLDEMAIRLGALMRFENRRGMHATVKSANLQSGFVEIFRNNLVEAGQGLGFGAAFEFLDVAFFDENFHRLLEWTGHADMPRPDDSHFIDDADAFGIAGADRWPHAFGKR